MWPEKQKYPTSAEIREINKRNPEEAAIRGKWSDPEFLQERVQAQSAAQGHAVRRLPRPRLELPRHLQARPQGHAARQGRQDGGGRRTRTSSRRPCTCRRSTWTSACTAWTAISGRTPTATATSTARLPRRSRSIARTATARPRAIPALFTSGPAARPGGMDLSLLRTQDGRKRFEWRGGKLYQRAALDPAKEWEMSLVKDTVNPDHPKYNPKAARAKLMSADASMQWGPGVDPSKYAHGDDKMTCFTCHLSWTTSCAGCHLPIQANWKTEKPALRRRRDAQLRHVQPAGRARRDVPARPPRPGEGRQDRAGALELGADPVVDQHQPREASTSSSRPSPRPASARRRSRRTTRTPSARSRRRPAPTATSRRRTTTTRSWRSCCCTAPTSSISSATTRGSARRAG